MNRAEEVLTDLAQRDSEVHLKRLFGYLAAWSDGRIAALALAHTVAVRLPAADRAEVMGLPGAIPLKLQGRPWRDWVELPAWVLDDPETLSMWLERATDRAPFLAPDLVDELPVELEEIFEG